MLKALYDNVHTIKRSLFVFHRRSSYEPLEEELRGEAQSSALTTAHRATAKVKVNTGESGNSGRSTPKSAESVDYSQSMDTRCRGAKKATQRKEGGERFRGRGLMVFQH